MGEKSESWDVIIIGGGPAGVAAAIYTSRALLKTLIIERGQMGGNITVTDRIENYPGFPGGIEAFELALRFRDHAVEFGARIENAEVTSLKLEGHVKVVETDKGAYRAKALIIAAGLVPNKLGIPGEAEFWGRGVSACATCDGPFYKGLKVAVVGGGNTAVEEAVYLTRFAAEVNIIHRRDELRATPLIRKRALGEPRIKFHWNSIPKRIIGAEVVEGIEIENVKTRETGKLDVSGVFVFVGYTPTSGYVGDLVARDKEGFIIVDCDMQTNVPGIYAAGDVVNPIYRQVVIATGEGARAALALEKYLCDNWDKF